MKPRFAQRPDELFKERQLDDRFDLTVWLEPHLGKGAVDSSPANYLFAALYSITFERLQISYP